MKKIIQFFLLTSCAALSIAPVQALPKDPNAPGIAQITTKSLRARVVAINKDTRNVTVMTPEGEKRDIAAGPEVRNFAQIQIGDEVTADYYQKISLFIDPPKEGAKNSVTTTTDRAEVGEMPSASTSTTLESRGVVEAINYDTREITLKGEAGKMETFKVSEEVKRFNNIKKGDELVFRATESVAIAVRRDT